VAAFGRAIVLSLTGAGAEVAFCYRRNDKAAAAVCAEARAQTGKDVLSVAGDITVSEKRRMLIGEVRDRFGGVDILVNNAGATDDGLAVRMTDAWEHLLDLNLSTPFRLSQLTIPLMLKRSWGRIINIGSIASRVGLAGQVNYTAAKAGLEGMTRSLAQEYGKRGITVNTVNPGFIETDLTENAGEFLRRYVTEHSSLGRYVTPEAIASTVCFLASDAAWALTGQTINVDGGLVKL
jgi:NAD(P)-dependent dehydrogenase (short-subunit alcohol dehydrogenase family)